MGRDHDATPTPATEPAAAPPPDASPSNQKEEQPGRRLLWHVAGWIAAAVTAAAVLFVVFGWVSGGTWWPWSAKWNAKKPPELFSVVRSTVTVVALLGGTVAAAIAIRRQRSTEQSVLISARAQQTAADAAQTAARAAEIAADAASVQARVYELDRERHAAEQIKDLRQRFITAAQQIGNADSPAVRIAGLYAMTALADDWINVDLPHEAQTCIDVLCAYLRMPPERDLDQYMREELPSVTLARDLASELEVRYTAQRLLVGYASRHQDPATAPDLDLTRAHLHNFVARDATFGGNFTARAATFSGNTPWFGGATFRGNSTSFADAVFSGEHIAFGGATFRGDTTSFDGATFSGEHTWFNDAIFGAEQTWFGRAIFGAEQTWFGGASFSGWIFWTNGYSSGPELPAQLIEWGARRAEAGDDVGPAVS